MALINCHECGNEVSTESKTCPKCGAKVRQLKKTSPVVKLLIFIVIFGFVAAIIMEHDKKTAQTPEQKAAEERSQQLALKRNLASGAALKIIRNNLRNPDSVQWSAVLANDDGSLLCIDYRAQNGFGGYGREIVVFVAGTAHTDAATWNKRCVGKQLMDVKTSAVRWMDRDLGGK